jgi:O-antigen polymerase
LIKVNQENRFQVLKSIQKVSDLSRIFLVLAVFLLFLLLPQINRSEYVLSTITSKSIYFFYGCVILLIFSTVSFIQNPKMSFSVSKLDVFLFLLLLYITFNRYFIQPYFGFSIRYLEVLGLSFLYIVLRSITIKNCIWLLLAVVISGIIQAVYGNLQLLGYYASNHSGFKMTGSFFNPGPYAGFLVSVWTVALGMYLFKETIITSIQSQAKNKAAYFNEYINYFFEYIPLFGIISIVVILPVLRSRASWIAAIVGSIVVLELRYNCISNLFKKVNTIFQKAVLFSLSIGIVSIGLFSIYHYKKGSTDGRAFIWKITTQMIADSPFFGLGFDRFTAQYMNYQADYFAIHGETQEALIADNTSYAFNEGLQFVAENGFLGLLFLMLAVLTLFTVKTNKEYEIVAFIAKTGILTIGVFACFSYPMQILPIKLVLVLLIAILSNVTTDDVFQFKIVITQSRRLIYKTIIVLLASVGIQQTITYTQRLSQGFITWGNALRSHQYGDYRGAVRKFELVYPVFDKEGNFLVNYGKSLAMAGKYSKAIEVLEQAKRFLGNTVIDNTLGDSYKAIKEYDKAEEAYQQAINMTPAKFYGQYLLAKLYYESRQKEKAIVLAQKILNKKIKIPSTAIQELRLEMKKILIKNKKTSRF